MKREAKRPGASPMESILQSPGVQELINEWKAKGRAEAYADAYSRAYSSAYSRAYPEGRIEEARRLLHRVLTARSFRVTPEVRARIDHEPDIACVEAWHEAAVTAGAIGEVFRDG
ncbi:MAG TPA: hypothetical protein VFK02_22145 [Kofleriaceae bacterium]|nr:hypothetical protein [Kofleriaceae bacterium]